MRYVGIRSPVEKLLNPGRALIMAHRNKVRFNRSRQSRSEYPSYRLDLHCPGMNR